MTHAYAESYLEDAMQNLGEAFDYAVNACGLDLDEFMQLFLASERAELFGDGNPKFVSGMSGTELAMSVLVKTGKASGFLGPQTEKASGFPAPQIEYDYSAEYWCGWILAYYQWKSGRSFRCIYDYLKMADIYKLYPILHEAPEDKFVDSANSIIAQRCPSTRLQARRKAVGLTQAALAEKAGVNLRTLQQYESGAKDINKAAAQKAAALAKALGCRVEELLEC